MYRKHTKGWPKHADFIVLDLLCLQLSLYLAYILRGQGFNLYGTELYRNMAVFVEFADIVVLFLDDSLKNVLKRGHYREFVETLKHTIWVGAVSVCYLFFVQHSDAYSRMIMLLTTVIFLVLSYAVRELWKYFVHKRVSGEGNCSLMIVTTSDVAESVIENMRTAYNHYCLTGLVLLDEDRTGAVVNGVPVVASAETAAEYVCKEWIDEVLVAPARQTPYPKQLMDQLAETGVTVHLNLLKKSAEQGRQQFVEQLGAYTVLTTTMNTATLKQLCLKRAMDIVCGLIGCIFTGILTIFLAPAIYISSPGPIFFSQERVGKNGKKFKMYKFRSMYIDAEARKAELMKENKMGDAKMFKMDFDPRVIGNQILPDGTKKTGIGEFIRKTSLDEFPQFFNVLKGDMSIVGTRPPLVGEVNLYELHHRTRLAIKPGITGMWQVSGRSDITDFEEVVRLDRQYIDEWSIGLDLKILLKTVLVVFKKEGSV